MSDEPEVPAGEPRRHGHRAALPLITSEDFDALAPEWAALHASLPDATPFSHPAWTSTWLRHFGASLQPVFLSVRADEALVGVAGLNLDAAAATNLGDPNVSDYAALLAAEGHEETVALGVLEWLMEDLTPALDLWGLPAGSAWPAAFAAAAERFGWTAAESAEAVCPRVALPGDFEEYVAALPSHDRHELRRKLRNLAAAGEAAYASYNRPDHIAARFDRFLDFMRLSHDDKGEFLTPAMEAFFRDLAATFSGLGSLRLGVLSLDGADAAMLLAFENTTTTFLYNSGYDPAFAPLAVGLLSKAYAVKDAIEQGKTSFDFLRGDEDYKRRLGGTPAAVVSMRLS